MPSKALRSGSHRPHQHTSGRLRCQGPNQQTWPRPPSPCSSAVSAGMLCTEKPRLPGARTGQDSGVGGISPRGVWARGVLTVALAHAGVELLTVSVPSAAQNGTLQRLSPRPGFPWAAAPQPCGPHALPRRCGNDWPLLTELGGGVALRNASQSSFKGLNGEAGAQDGSKMSSLNGWIHLTRWRRELPPVAWSVGGCGGGVRLPARHIVLPSTGSGACGITT
mmetsp:Transcript_75232/g.220577  ORF Transcript_75232/g.220577 Transcript_75232/m.220577 type:complete len:222 (-) Transcript_75232:1021-1686(-)